MVLPHIDLFNVHLVNSIISDAGSTILQFDKRTNQVAFELQQGLDSSLTKLKGEGEHACIQWQEAKCIITWQAEVWAILNQNVHAAGMVLHPPEMTVKG